MQTDVETFIFQLEKEIKEDGICLNAGVQSLEILVFHQVVNTGRVAIEHTFCHRDIIIDEAANSTIGTNDILVTKTHRPMRAYICPISMFSPDNGRLKTIPDRHNAGEIAWQ